jgi:hypothetical protein
MAWHGGHLHDRTRTLNGIERLRKARAGREPVDAFRREGIMEADRQGVVGETKSGAPSVMPLKISMFRVLAWSALSLGTIVQRLSSSALQSITLPGLSVCFLPQAVISWPLETAAAISKERKDFPCPGSPSDSNSIGWYEMRD